MKTIEVRRLYTMNRTFLIVGSSFLVLTAVGFGGWNLYQNHLSGDLRHILIAACDPAATEADRHAYVREARLHVHTKKDQSTFDKLARAIQLEERASETRSLILSESMRDVRDRLSGRNQLSDLVAIENEYRELRMAVPADLKKDIDDAIAKEKEDSQQHKEESKRAENEQAAAKSLYTDLRSDLGLPQLRDN